MSRSGYRACGFCGEIYAADALNEIQVAPTYASGESGPAISEFVCDACEEPKQMCPPHVVLPESGHEGICTICGIEVARVQLVIEDVGPGVRVIEHRWPPKPDTTEEPKEEIVKAIETLVAGVAEVWDGTNGVRCAVDGCVYRAKFAFECGLHKSGGPL